MNRQSGFLYLLISIALLICLAMVSPFLGYILAGLILAYITYPLKSRLDNFIGGKYSSSLTIVVTFLLAIVPLALLVGAVADDAASVVNYSGQIDNLDISGIENRIEDLAGQELDIRQRIKSSIQTIGSTVLSGTSQILGLASSVALGVSLMVFTQFYGLKDGRNFVEWTKRFDLMPTDMQNRLYAETGKSIKAVVKGHVFVAIATGLIAGLGLIVTGVPNAFFWTFVMMFLGLIPLIGTTIVWAPASVYLFLNNSVVSAVFLALYGLIVVGATDNFLRPFFVDEEADIHPLYIILGVVGGIGVFGIIGIFIGPVMFGVAKSLLVILQEHLDEFV